MTKVIAHRGASKVAPENTMAAFKKAHSLGAYGVELDVHVLPDRTVVVHHDGKLGRCESCEGSIYNYNRESIQTFSVGKWFSEEFAGERMPLFEDVLAFLKENEMYLNCEIKCDTGFCYPYEDAVLEVIEKSGMREQTIISSFDHRLLKRIKDSHPEYLVGALYAETYGFDMIDYCTAYGFDAIHPLFTLVDLPLVEKAHKHNMAVNVWTVDKSEDIGRMISLGVDTIITNDVETGLKELKPHE